MTVESLPWSIQGQSHAAEVARNALAAIMGAPASAETAAVGLFAGGSHGVIGADDLDVTQNGTPNLSVNVAAGRALIRSTESASLDAGLYSFFNNGTVNLAISAAHATNPRRDLIVAQVRDANYSGASNGNRLFVVTGTAAAVPADPTVPNSCIVLARVAVGALDTTITNADITDLRTFAMTHHRLPWGHIAYAEVTANQTGITTQANLTGLTVTFTARSDRRYRTTFRGEINGTAAGDLVIAYITDGSNVAKQRATLVTSALVGGASYAVGQVAVVESGLSGSTTRKVRLERNSGAGSAALGASATNPAYILVEDIGPA